MRRLLAAGIPALVLAGALVAVLLPGSDHSAGDNAKPVEIGVVVPGGRTFCQSDNIFPAEAHRLRVWVSTAGRPGGPLDLTITGGGRTLATGHAAGGYVDSPVDLPLEKRGAATVQNATVCIRNGGARQAAFMGARAGISEAPARAGNAAQPQASNQPGTQAAHINGLPASKQQPIAARLDFRTAGGQSWLDLAPTIARRASYARAGFFGSWTLWAVGALMLAAAAGAITLVTREALRR